MKRGRILGLGLMVFTCFMFLCLSLTSLVGLVQKDRFDANLKLLRSNKLKIMGEGSDN
jgi:hypothetical protein